MADAESVQVDENRLVQERIRKLKEIREKGVNPYPYSFTVTHKAIDIQKEFGPLKEEEKSETVVSVAGRIMSDRAMGKAAFLHIMDASGKQQVYLRQDDLGDAYKLIKKLDIGDFIGVTGSVFRTKKGELSVHAQSFEILTKSLRPLPEKYHGLQDPELRYRKRYLDLIMNEKVRDTFTKRAHIIREIRSFLDARGFVEVETPILQPLYGGAAARPFTTHHNALDIPLYMKISPELYLKRLIVGGFDKVYDMNKNFRNEGVDRSHNPEFTMIEWYEAYTDYEYQMKQFEELVASVAKSVCGTTKVPFGEHTIDLTPPWKRLTMIDAINEIGGVDVTSMDDAQLKTALQKHDVELPGKETRGAMIAALFEELVEDKLIQPTFIIDHPIETSPLTKVKRGNDALVERFEPFIAGMEFGNAYSELNDPIDQRARLESQVEERDAGDDEAHPMDEDFVEAIEYGMPPTGGVGLGVGRLVMLLTNNTTIREVILFPTMKPDVNDLVPEIFKRVCDATVKDDVFVKKCGNSVDTSSVLENKDSLKALHKIAKLNFGILKNAIPSPESRKKRDKVVKAEVKKVLEDAALADKLFASLLIFHAQ